MIKVFVPASEVYDEKTETFVSIKECTLQLEHSLISLSRWEAIWEKPFLDDNVEKTNEMLTDYIRCMALNSNVDERVYNLLTKEQIEQISNYINSKQTATWFSESPNNKFVKRKGIGSNVITSEIIYYLMTAYQIPFECQKWHLNRLITLIRVCEEKNKQPEKMTKSQIMERNRKLNEARRKALNSKG